MTMPGECNESSSAAFVALKLSKKVGNARISVRQAKRHRVNVSARGEGAGDQFAFNLNARRAVCQNNTHDCAPEKTQRNQLGQKSYVSQPVSVLFSGQAQTYDHPQTKAILQEPCYRQRSGNRPHTDQFTSLSKASKLLVSAAPVGGGAR